MPGDPLVDWSKWVNWLESVRPLGSSSTAGFEIVLPGSFRQLNDHVYEVCKPPAGEKPSVEIAFFHGLQLQYTSEPHIRTWLSRKKTTLWLTWLLEEHPNARILTVSVDASMADMFIIGENLRTCLTDSRAALGHDRCPVILVGHCLGGLVIKEILVKADSVRGQDTHQRRLRNFLTSVKGIFFYATPHHGSQLSNTGRSFSEGPLFKVATPLDPDTQRRNEDFRKLREVYGWRSRAVGESEVVKLRSFTGLIVEEASARFDVDQYYTINANHFDVCRPESPVSGSFLQLVDFITEVLEKEIKQIQKEEMLQAMKSIPASYREQELRRAASRNYSNYLSSSSADGVEHQHKRTTLETSKPKVDFGANIVAEGLIATITNGQKYRKWMGLWGMGGIGKTFTARKVYNDDRIKRHFGGGRFWVTVSKDGIPVTSLLGNLFENIVKFKEILSILPDTLEERKAIVKELLNTPKRKVAHDVVLLVIDDVWEPEILEWLDVISEERKGIILVTARDDRIFEEQTHITEIRPLSEDHSWQLFSWYAFQDHGKNLPSSLESTARDVAAECQGLPLALEVIGASMRSIHVSSRESRRGKGVETEWKRALGRLRSANVCGSAYDRLYARLQLSVEHLSEVDSRLQACFFDLAAFPEDWHIPVQDLVTMWIADGLVKVDADSEDSDEDEALYLVGLLAAKSMVQFIPSDRSLPDIVDDNIFHDGDYCKIHDVMRDLARRNLKIDSKRKEIPEHERECLYVSGRGLDDFPESWSIFDRLFVRKLSLFGNDLNELPQHFNAPDLRVFILQRNNNFSLEGIRGRTFFTKLSNLRVLNLADTGIETICDEVVDSLKSLVLLDVRRCRRLRMISRRIENLNNLKTILLEGCAKGIVLTPPKGLRSLSGYSGGKEVCKWLSLRSVCMHCTLQLSGISSLHRLEVLELETADGLPTEVIQLSHLKILKVVLEGKRYPPVEIPRLGELPRLEVLWLKIRSLGLYFPPSFAEHGSFPRLKEMKLEAGPSFGSWFTCRRGTMPQIRTLTLICSGLGLDSTGLLKSLRELDSLVTLNVRLYLTFRFDLQNIFCKANCFPNLQNFRLYATQTNYKLPIGLGALPKLRYVEYGVGPGAHLCGHCAIDGGCKGYDCPARGCPKNIPLTVLELERQGKLDLQVRPCLI